MHNGLLRFTGEKMSKSVGNVATIQDVIAEWGREAALLFFLTGHWRKPLEFSEETMAAAGAQVESLRNALRGETRAAGDWERFAAALDDDFNTPAALALFHRWAREGALDELRRGLAVFGLGRSANGVEAPADGRRARPRARRRHGRARDFAESDRLRDEIAAAGWEVRDTPGTPAASSSCRSRDARPRLRPQRGARGAARPPRGARALGLRAGGRGARLARRRAAAPRASRSAS